MTDTLERDLRAAFATRAAEVDDAAVAPERAYVVPLAAAPHRRRWPVAVAGAAAAAVAVAALAAGSDTSDPEPVRFAQQPTATSTPPPPALPEDAFAGGRIDGRAWSLVSQDGVVRLRADGLVGSFEGRFGTVRIDADPDLLFAQLGPCCRLGDRVLMVGAVAPDATGIRVTLADGTAVDASAAADPAAPESYRFVVVPLPADGGPVTVEVQRADGTSTPVTGAYPLDQVGG